MAPETARPSGLERVRWKVSARSPTPMISPRMEAPRAIAVAMFSSTRPAAPSPITKPSRDRLKGREAAAGSSLRLDRACSRPKRIIVSGVSEASAPPVSAASVSPRRIASMASWMAEAPEAQAVVTDCGMPVVPKRSARARAGMMNGWPRGMARAALSTIVACDAPPSRISAWRCGHSSSTGGSPMLSGPGKGRDRPDCATASARARLAITAMRSAPAMGRPGRSPGRSTQAPMRLRMPAVSKRVMARMPERPASSPAQLVATSMPKAVTRPMPVTAMRGRPR